MKFLAKYLFSTSFSRRKVFENRLNTFGDIAFFLTQCTAWKWEISNFSTRKKFSPYHCKTKIAAPWNFRPKYLFSTSFSRRKVFENRLNTFGDIAFFLTQCTAWKWEISNFSTWKKFSPYHCKTKIAAPMKFLGFKYLFSTSFSGRKVFENRLNTFGDIAFFLTQCTAWKWEISNFSTWKKFSPYHCKTKIAAPMKFSAQIPIFHIFQQKKSFWKSVEYLWWYSIFSGTVCSLELGNFKFSFCNSFHLTIAKLK